MAGQSFLTNAFGSAKALVEIAFGADITAAAGTWSWTDVSVDLMHTTQVRITQGRTDETSTAQAASCSFTLLNTTGKYTPFSPGSSLYPNVKKGTPVRVSIDVGSGFKVAFFGFAAGFTPAWDTSAKLATVQVSAGGLLRRLGQGSAPVTSPMARTIPGTSPLAWWPMESGSSTTQAPSGLPGGAPLMVTTGSFSIGTDAPAGATGAGAFPSGGGTLTGRLPATASSSYRLEFSVKPNTIASGDFIAILDWLMPTGGVALWEIGANANGEGGLYAQWLDGSGDPGAFYSSNVAIDNGVWHHIRVDVSTSGGNQVIKVAIDGVQVINQNTGVAYGAPQTLTVNPTGAPGEETPLIAQLTYWAPWAASVDTYSAFTGYRGETATARITRNCSEQGVTLTLSGSSAMTMGPQPATSFLNILRECETADGGLLLDGFDAGIVYIARSSRYNISADLTIDASAGQLSPPFAPIDDDQRIRNDFTVSRSSGAPAQYADTSGPLGTTAVGDFDSSLTVNTDNDNVLPLIAAWNVHLGTVEGLRYPNLVLDFVAVPTKANAWLTAGYPGQVRLDVTNLTSEAAQAPPDAIQLMVEGWTLTFDVVSMVASVNCSPYEPWRITSIETGTNPLRIDSDASVLASSALSGASAVSVASTGPVWTTTAAFPSDFPFDIDIAGEQLTVTAIANAATDTFTRSVSNGWGSADSSQAWTTQGGTAADFAVNGTRGEISAGTVSVNRRTFLNQSCNTLDLYIDVRPEHVATGAPIEMGSIFRSDGTGSNEYFASLLFDTSGGVSVRLTKTVAGSSTALVTVATAITYTSTSTLTLRVQAWGTAIRLKTWLAGAEPSDWNIDTTDATFTASGSVGTRTTLQTGNTNTSPVVVHYDNLALINPQRFTVTRSVNGVVKAQANAAPVSLWHPASIAL